ncbi:MAG: MBL fold metallo-hydrolase [Candidatus Hydrogenedentota bacterium]|nr:MAG: MBL fold metallo-hydrolase [Candidatus Hydrogenedentota bacterium]
MKLLEGNIAVEEVAPSLFKITVPQPFYSPNHVYLIRDKQNMLIDSGYIESIRHLAASLNYLGLSFRKIDYLFYTHPHIDHITGGFLIRRYANVQTMGHYQMDKDIPDYLADQEIWAQDTARLLKLAFRDKEIRSKRIHRSLENHKRFMRRFQNPAIGKVGDNFIHLDHHLKHGDVIETGQFQFEVIETPGHSKWHLTPIEHKQKWIFTGDLIIGNLTAIYSQLDGDLIQYIRTMNHLKKFQEYRFFPAHGKEIKNPAKRIKTILKTLNILEYGILRRLKEKPMGLLDLMESAMGTKVSSGALFHTALAMTESVLRKMIAEQKIYSKVYDDEYEEFFFS